MFNTPYSRNKSFCLTLICNPKKSEVISINNNENIIFLNPDYIVSSYHILLGVNRACYNLENNKCKTKKLKGEIIHCLTNENKLDASLKLHSVENNEENSYYVIFVNMKKEEIEKIKEKIGGNEISSINYSKFVNTEKLMRAFQIKKEEIMALEDGISACVYNRISTKELK